MARAGSAAHHSPSQALICCAQRSAVLLLAQVNNIAELLLVRGLAQVVRHRGDEERSGVCCVWG